jgi:hypothetical protein
MPDDLDHEVIDSPQALFRHLYEAHAVLEALDLDPATAPLQFWLRKHTELERAARAATRDRAAAQVAWASPTPEAARGAPPGGPRSPERLGGSERPRSPERRGPPEAPRSPERPTSAGSGPRFRPFADPLVEALAAALVGRGMEERRVRRGLATFSGADGRFGEDAVRTVFVAPMLDAVAAHLAGDRPDSAHLPPVPAATPAEVARADPAARTPMGREPNRQAPAPREPNRQAPAPREPNRQAPAPREPNRQAPAPREPNRQAPAPREPIPREPAAVRAGPPAAEHESWVAQPLAARAAGPEPDADFMAIADVLQERRRSRGGGRRDGAARPVTTAPPASPAPAGPPAREPDDDVMALANALQHRRRGRTGAH